MTGSSLTFDRLPMVEVLRRQGIPVVIATRAVFDACRLACDVREAVVAIDMAVTASHHVDRAPERPHVDLASIGGSTALDQVRSALSLARERSWSPRRNTAPTTWTIDARLPRPRSSTVLVHDLDGRLLGIADLLDPIAGLVVEFDGADHRDSDAPTPGTWPRTTPSAHSALEVARVTGSDVRHRGRVVDAVLAGPKPGSFAAAPQYRRWQAAPRPGRSRVRTSRTRAACGDCMQAVVERAADLNRSAYPTAFRALWLHEAAAHDHSARNAEETGEGRSEHERAGLPDDLAPQDHPTGAVGGDLRSGPAPSHPSRPARPASWSPRCG